VILPFYYFLGKLKKWCKLFSVDILNSEMFKLTAKRQPTFDNDFSKTKVKERAFFPDPI